MAPLTRRKEDPNKQRTPRKRRAPRSPTKRSPYQKKLNGRPIGHVTPKRGAIKELRKVTLRGPADEELAAPLGNTESNKSNNVTPFKIFWRRRDTAKSSSPHALNKLLVPPLKITWKKRTEPKASSSQSSNDYKLERGVPLARDVISGRPASPPLQVSPARIHLKRRVAPASPHTECLTKVQALHPQVTPVDDCDVLPFPPDETTPHSKIPCPLASTTVVDIAQPAPDDSAPLNNGPRPDYVKVVLNEDDVDGAKLPRSNIASNVVVDLKRWLKCRGLPVGGRKKDLVERIQACKDLKRDHIIHPAVDSSKPYAAKRNELLALQGLDDGKTVPSHGWETFPSKDIPEDFNFGSVYHYLVETMPQYVGDENDSDSSGDEEVYPVVEVRDPFSTTENDEMLRCKKLRRGLTYFKSNYVKGCEDVIEDRCHYFKGHVRASMNKQAYWVHVSMSQVSGRIIFCECDETCSQRALGRCSHVGAMLLYILGHTRLNGFQGMPPMSVCVVKGT